MLKEDYINNNVKTIQYAYIYYDKNGKELAYSIPGSEIEFSGNTTEEDKKTIYNDCGSHLNFIRIINKKIKRKIKFSEEEKANYYVGTLVISLPIYSFDGINMPKIIEGSFDCFYSRLASLKGAPEVIKGSFNCSGNKLTSLEGCPQDIGESLDCSNNQLASLKGAPEKINGRFDCSRNQLKNLIGGPKMVGIDYCCNNNKLTSLEGAPEVIIGNFDCSYNTKLSKEEIYNYLKSATIYGNIKTPYGLYDNKREFIMDYEKGIKESYFGY